MIDEYKADDESSMKDNNTSSFCYRLIAGTKVLSKHGKGVAIDINPLYNPQVKNGTVYPSISKPYADRSKNVKGMIKKVMLAIKHSHLEDGNGEVIGRIVKITNILKKYNKKYEYIEGYIQSF